MSPFDPWRHRYALVCAGATAGLIVAGGLVTSTGSGLAVPDWPLSFGTLFPEMTGGVLFEHGHRLVAAAVGCLTLVLAAWFARRESREWVRRMAHAAIAMIVAQGLLGGLTVLLRLPPSVSVLHACLGQAFFCVVVLLAAVTSRSFVEGPPLARTTGGARAPWIAGAVTVALLFSQLVLGAVMRHTGAGLAIPDVPLAFGRLVPPFASFEIAVHYAHRVLGIVAAAAVCVMAARALRRRADTPGLAGPACLAVVLVVAQVLLGVTTVLTRLAVLPATAHVLGGALLLATCCVFTARAARLDGARVSARGKHMTDATRGAGVASPSARTAGSAA